MIDIWIVLALLAIHFVADFVLQTDWQAKNKSSRCDALLSHTFLYGLCFAPFFGAPFALVNFLLHTGIDFVTSRITKRLYEKGRVHDFFVVIGLDQLLHYACLLITYVWLKG